MQDTSRQAHVECCESQRTRLLPENYLLCDTLIFNIIKTIEFRDAVH